MKNGISSAPVYNTASKTLQVPDQSHACLIAHPSIHPLHRNQVFSVGMFDYQDLVSYILIVFNKNQWTEKEDNIEIREIVLRALRSQPVQVKLVSDLSHRNPFYSGMRRACSTNDLKSRLTVQSHPKPLCSRQWTFLGKAFTGWLLSTPTASFVES